MNPRSSYSMALAAHDISDAMDKLFADQIERHAWLIRAGEQIRNHREQFTMTRPAWREPKLAYIYLLIETFAETLPEDSAAEIVLRSAMSKVDEADMCLKGISIQEAK